MTDKDPRLPYGPLKPIPMSPPNEVCLSLQTFREVLKRHCTCPCEKNPNYPRLTTCGACQALTDLNLGYRSEDGEFISSEVEECLEYDRYKAEGGEWRYYGKCMECRGLLYHDGEKTFCGQFTNREGFKQCQTSIFADPDRKLTELEHTIRFVQMINSATDYAVEDWTAFMDKIYASIEMPKEEQ